MSARQQPAYRFGVTPKRLSILDVLIDNMSMGDSLIALKRMLSYKEKGTALVCFINIYNLAQAYADAEYQSIVHRADLVLPDGAGLWLAARLSGVVTMQNVPGTDMVPAFLDMRKECPIRLFLLGSKPDIVARAVQKLERYCPGVSVVGYHHGYFRPQYELEVLSQINAAEPDILLVGMGTPLQEKLIDRYRGRLKVPLSIAVGGLFEYWAGNLRRAPLLLRRLRLEWLAVLLQQPFKWKRYLFEAPITLARTIGTTYRSSRQIGSSGDI